MTTLSKNKVVLGLSGGVDSTAAALLLREKGYEVIGFYFDVLGSNEKGVAAAEDLAQRLGIRLIKADVSSAFSDIVISNFCSEYACGRTPNPCVICNPHIKFKALLEVAEQQGAYYIATGHYAKVFYDEAANLFFIGKGANVRKDQSYMLYRLGQPVLSRLIFPLGEFTDKEEIRSIVRAFGLPNAETCDSQEICFIDDSKEHYGEYLSRHGYSAKEGNFVDEQANPLGRHKGLIHYTVGQRKGLGIALGRPVFVTAIDPCTNEIVLGDEQALYKKELYSADNFFTATSSEKWPDEKSTKISVSAKIRYGAKPSKAIVSREADGRILTVFEEPQRAATPGQSVVFYQDDLVIGGGFIE